MKNLSLKQFKILPHMKEMDDFLVEKLLRFDSAMPRMWAGLSSPLNNACELRCCTTTESLQTSWSPSRTPAQCEMIIYISGVSSFSLALLRLITVEETKIEKHTRLMEVQEFINLFNRSDLSLMWMGATCRFKEVNPPNQRRTHEVIHVYELTHWGWC